MPVKAIPAEQIKYKAKVSVPPTGLWKPMRRQMRDLENSKFSQYYLKNTRLT